MRFQELAVGAVFTAWTYRKTAISIAEDERHWGCAFFGEIEAVSDGPLVAARRRRQVEAGPRRIESANSARGGIPRKLDRISPE
jgi:hypothetical protein